MIFTLIATHFLVGLIGGALAWLMITPNNKQTKVITDALSVWQACLCYANISAEDAVIRIKKGCLGDQKYKP